MNPVKRRQQIRQPALTPRHGSGGQWSLWPRPGLLPNGPASFSVPPHWPCLLLCASSLALPPSLCLLIGPASYAMPPAWWAGLLSWPC
ncbi:hypothetical protein EYF80_009771 [Liparis tanakae]|uniref:Uncharacterized protein n=1 Tax=Liparis tanakae TaxID=230148 RepID=A0A4Z2IQZ0_9TELE|nr:hypothetical protein EYF80_009771 [Liparis tanakae]